MVPETAKKPIARKCPICDKKLISKEALVNHIDKSHANQIPDNWSAARYENYLRTGVKCGNCTECGKPTEWNDSTWKYNRLCGDPKCIAKVSSRAKKNMIAKHGVVHKLNDPEMQRKMIYSKRNSGAYYFSEDKEKKYKIMYASSQEKNFLEMLDAFLNMDPSDIMGPSPHTYTYKYEGEDHFYIPDYYISSLNLEIEIKEPLNNQNNHPKIQAIDKVKEELKDDLMKSIDEVNYIKINGTDYSQFFAFLSALKDADDVIFTKPVVRGIIESESPSLESTDMNLADVVSRYNDLFKMTLDLKQPGLTFDSTLALLKKHIQTCKKGDIAHVEKELNRVENEIYEISLKKPQDSGSENVYEAKKALKVIREKLRPMLEAKKRALLESVIYMGDSEIDYNVAYTEATDISAYKNGKTYKPVFVVLASTYTPAGVIIRNVTGQPYTHACISLDTTMDNLATFNAFISDGSKRGGGFTPSESFKFGGYTDERCTYAIYMYLAQQDEYMTIDQLINQFKDNADKFKYSFRGCIDYLFNRTNKRYSGEYFCSEFVADILKNANPKLVDKNPHVYSPGDFVNNRKLRFVISGKCVDYDAHKTDLKVAKILKERGMQGVEIK